MAARTAFQRRSSSAVEIGLISRSAKSFIPCSQPLRGHRHCGGSHSRRTAFRIAPKCVGARISDISLHFTCTARNSQSLQAISIADWEPCIYLPQVRNWLWRQRRREGKLGGEALANDACERLARRQVRPEQGPDLRDRLPGAGAA